MDFCQVGVGSGWSRSLTSWDDLFHIANPRNPHFQQSVTIRNHLSKLFDESLRKVIG